MIQNEQTHGRFNVLNSLLLILSLSQALFIDLCFGHSTPSELLDLSFDQLMLMEVDSEDANGSEAKGSASAWHLGYDFKFLSIEDFQQGTTKIDKSQVLFTPGNNQRSASNYRIVSLRIIQKAHIFSLYYRLDELSKFQIFMPYISQSSDHVSSVPGYESFTLESQGIGDLNVSLIKTLHHHNRYHFQLQLGLSLPTGSIDEEGDTPRAPGNQRIPYPMQLGSGTWDFPMGLRIVSNYSDLTWDAQASVKLRTRRNEFGYRLGDRYAISSSVTKSISKQLSMDIGLRAEHISRIVGEDQALRVPGNFPFPANIADTNNYGGSRLFFTSTATYSFDHFRRGLTKLSFGVRYPIIQDVNGVQPIEQPKIEFRLKTTL